MKIELTGNAIIANGERHEFASAAEADRRYRFISEAVTWIGTPFVHCADVKGRMGGVDCAMMLVRSSVDTGLLPRFDPRPYSPDWHLHHNEEKFIEWIETKLGAREIEKPEVGDVIVFRVARCFAHGAVMIGSNEICHAWFSAGLCLNTRIDLPLLDFIDHGAVHVRRPRRHFTLWKD